MRLRYLLLLVFLVLSLGPLLLFRAWPYSEVLQGELDEVQERHLLLANNLAAALERYHRDLVTTFDLFALADDHWSDTPATRRVLENLAFRHVCWADWSTGQVVDSLALLSTPCPDTIPAATLEGLRQIAVEDAVSFGHVSQAPDGENVIHLVTRRGDQIVVGAITTAYFRELGEAISFGVLGHAAIVDHSGRALSHPRPDWVETRKDMSAISAVQRMLNRETGVEVFYSPALDGDMIAGFTFVHPVGWGVMIPQPIAELYQRADEARQSSLIVLFIGTVLAFLLATVISLRAVRPLEQLSRMSDSIASGKLSGLTGIEKTRFMPIEMVELQARLQEMIRRLGENMSTINGLAFTDPVTGLGNRTAILRTLDAADSSAIDGALILIDLDDFKAVNDTHGHDAGDAVLNIVGERLLDAVGADRVLDCRSDAFRHEPTFDGLRGLVARLGGDEYALWVPHKGAINVDELAGNIVAALREDMKIGETVAHIGASVGIAQRPGDASNRFELMKAADIALYQAKNSGKNQHALFTPALKEAEDAFRKFTTEIDEGLQDGQFVPFFQPQFSLPDRTFAGVEALVRWQHPTLGTLEPSEFLAVAEEMGILHHIDRAVFEQSVDYILALDADGLGIGSLAVNVSETRLKSPDFLEAVQRLPDLPFELRFELIETIALDRIDGRLAWALETVRRTGHKLDMDDFGAGQTSVAGLMNLQPAHLKIGRQLIGGMQDGAVAERFVRSIVEMGHALGIPIIAEGAEEMSMVRRLEEMKCDFVQGYALAKPMDIHQLTSFLQSSTDMTTPQAG